MWKNPEKLSATLKRLSKKVAKSTPIDLVTVTMTAELSDVYRTKREGVNHILNQALRAFPNTQTLVLSVDGKLITPQEAKVDIAKVAAANWAATGWLISQLKKNCIAIDIGSTTTSIIPIINGVVSTEGKTDMEKLVCGELVYTGSLRTNVAAIVNTVPVKSCLSRVSSELFAQSADVHLVLGNISEEDYTVETADGKEKTRKASLTRLARVVCADTEMLTEKDTVQIAQYVYSKQIEQIASSLAQVCSRITKNRAKNIEIVVTGLGRNFLARKAASKAGFSEVTDFGELAGNDVARVTTAFAAALMGASHVEGGSVRWMQ
jgi:probable H4MPT-linked C1 transfer pathway protein